MNIQHHNFSSIKKIQGQYLPANKPQIPVAGKEAFNQILEKHLSTQQDAEIKFSKHANERLEDRNIALTHSQLNRLQLGFEKAEAKGIKESLVLMDNMAFLVSVKNKTVITAMSQEESGDKIFTNIDGAVLL